MALNIGRTFALSKWKRYIVMGLWLPCDGAQTEMFCLGWGDDFRRDFPTSVKIRLWIVFFLRSIAARSIDSQSSSQTTICYARKALLRFIIFNVFMLPYLGMLRGSYTVETVVTSNAWILSAAEPFIKFLFTCKCMEKTNNEKKRPLRVHLNIYWTIYWCQMVKFALAATINYIGAPNGMIPCVAITKPGGRR